MEQSRLEAGIEALEGIRSTWWVPEDSDLGEVEIVRETLLTLIVCTRLPIDEAAEYVTERRPSGTSHGRWSPVDPEDVSPSPTVPCAEHDGLLHHVLVC